MGVLLCAGIAALLALLAYRHPVPEERFGQDVVNAVEICTRTNANRDSLMLGDSVARQFFEPAEFRKRHPRLAMAASNDALTPMGNLVLLREYLRHNPQTKSVYYFIRPISLFKVGGRKYAFHYMIYPLAESGLFGELPLACRRDLERRFGFLAIHNKSLRRLLYRNDGLCQFYNDFFVQGSHVTAKGHIPEENMNSLLEMDAVCRKHGATLHLAPAPLAEPMRERHIEKMFLGEDLGGLAFAARYVDSISYFPTNLFVDDIHMKPDYVEEHREEILGALPGLEGVFNQ